MRTITRLSAAVVMASLVAACSGGGVGRVTPGVLTTNPTITNPTITQPSQQSPGAPIPVSLSVNVPGRVANAHSRVPDYVSVNTKGASFTVGQLKNGNTVTIAANTASCGATCKTTTNLIPGSYFVTVSLFDTAPASTTKTIPTAAKRLSFGTTQAIITAGAVNAISITLAGDVAKIKTSITPTAIKKGSGVKPQTIVQAFDPSGALIAGPMSKKIKTTAKGKSGAVGQSVLRTVYLDESSVYSGARIPQDTTTPTPAPTNSDGSVDLTNAGTPETLNIPADDSDPSVCVEASDDGAAPEPTPDPNATQDPTAQSARRVAYIAPTPLPTAPPGSDGTDAPSSACVTISGGNPEQDPPSGGSPDLIGGNANGTPQTSPTPVIAAGAPFTSSTPTAVTSPVPVPVPSPGVSYMSSFGVLNALYGALNGSTAMQVVALYSPIDASNVGPNPLIAGAVDYVSAPQNGSATGTFVKKRASGIHRHPSRVTRPLRVAKLMRTPFHTFRSAAPGPRSFRRVRNSPPAFPAVGGTKTFFMAGASSTSSAVNASVIANDTSASRYAVYATAGAAADGLSSSVAPTIAQMVANADTVVTGLFGDATTYSTTNTAAAANPQYVSVVLYDQTADVTNASDTNIPNTLGSAIGFFNPQDLYSSSLVTSGLTNQAPVIFVSWNGGTDTTSMANLQGAITREYANLNLYIQNELVNGAPDEPAWLVAGLGSIADDYTAANVLNGAAATTPTSASVGSGGSPPSAPVYDIDNSLQFAATYLYNPSSYSLTGFAGVSDQTGTYAQNLPGNYGASYLFMKYFTDRYGLGFLQSLVGASNGTNVGAAAVVAAANANGATYPTGTTNGSGPASTDGFTAMMQDFVTAQAAALDGSTATTGPVPASLQLLSFNLGSPVYPNTITSSVTGNSVTFMGPNTVGNYAITDTATGQTPPSVPLYYGSTVFLGVDATGSTLGVVDPNNGGTVRADDLVSGQLNLQGLIVQQ